MSRDNYSRTVYTTETGRICPECGKPISECQGHKNKPGASGSAPSHPEDGVIRVQLDRKGRAGKTVSVITGVKGSEAELTQLTTELKRRCGAGGTLKGNVIEIQGDHRDTLVEFLKSRGFKVKRSGG